MCGQLLMEAGEVAPLQRKKHAPERVVFHLLFLEGAIRGNEGAVADGGGKSSPPTEKKQ